MRSRIRTTLLEYDKQNLVPKYLHDNEYDNIPRKSDIVPNDVTKVLPVLALNEVCFNI